MENYKNCCFFFLTMTNIVIVGKEEDAKDFVEKIKTFLKSQAK